MGRKRKITYDSKESKVIYALLCFLLAILLGLTYFVEEAPFFQLIREVFAETVFLVSLFFINLGLFFLNKDWRMSKVSSLIAQIIVIAIGATFLNSFVKPRDAQMIAEEGASGGLLGFYIREQLAAVFGLGVLQFLSIFILAIATPVAFSLSLNQIFRFLEKFISQIISWIRGAIPDVSDPDDKEESEKKGKKKSDKEEGENKKEQKKAEMFSDFSKDKREAEKKKKEQEEESEKKKKDDQPKVKVKEVSSGDGAMVNEEGLQFPNWEYPPLDLLNDYKEFTPPKEDFQRNSDIIEQTLESFKVKAKVVDVLVGPTVTQYALDIALGTKVSKIQNLSNDLALALAVSSNAIRIEAPIAGTSYVGVEVPNSKRQFINVREVMEGREFQRAEHELPVVVGKDINGDDLISNIQKMPHLLIAGATGSGKSVVTNTFILSLLMKKSPDEVRMIMVDPKQVELSDYNGIPHLLTPVITDMNKVSNALKWAVAEMEHRYTLFREEKVRNLEMYNKKKGYAAVPYIVVIIDEMADMMMTGGSEIEGSIVRLAQKARAVGIHLILATQRPSVDVITGVMKANIPGRIGLSVATQVDSRVILDQVGAEALLGKGDMLFKEPDQTHPVRIQGVWTASDEIQRVVKYIKEQVPEVEYTKEVLQGAPDPNLPKAARESAQFSDDEYFSEAVRIVVSADKGSASLLQRKLSIGYNRAARLLDDMQKYGIVGKQKGSKPREVRISDAESFLSGGENDDEVDFDEEN